MIKALSILVLLLVSLPQRNAVVIPTKLTVDPIPFRKGALISIHASFGQVAESKCPSPSPIFKDLSDGFGIKIYDAKDVPTEPSDMLGKETKYIASTTATVNPTDDDNAKKVERDFESVKIPENAPGRIYVVEPTGPFMDDPNVTDRKFPGNPTKSYRSKDPLRVVSEHLDWQGHSPEEIQAMKDFIADKEPIDD